MADAHAAHRRHLPGDIAVWFFIFAELAVFGILFIGYGVARSLDPATFSAGKEALHPWTGLINTVGL
ncbi:MAG: cytochrome oxidase subunit III, partial [Marinobacter nauticus]|nr:cytochrome oxidase subunit III [Marinobacter nauticus]